MNANPMIHGGAVINQTWNASIHLDHSAVSAFVGLLDMVKIASVKVSKRRIFISHVFITRHASSFPEP